MVMDMVDSAARRLPPGAAPILHSDQGWQYQHKHYQKRLIDYGIIQSMSRKDNCLDNAVIKNFCVFLKSELLYLHKFDGTLQTRTD